MIPVEKNRGRGVTDFLVERSYLIGIGLGRAYHEMRSVALGFAPRDRKHFRRRTGIGHGFGVGLSAACELSDVAVTIGGVAAPLFYVSAGQVNLQVPFEVTQGETSIVIKRSNGLSYARSVQVLLSSPGIFTASGDGYNAPVIVHTSDYSQVMIQKPAHPGEILAIFCTGLGAVNGSVRAGDAAPASTIHQPLDVVVDSGLISLTPYAGLAPGFAGLYQVNFQLPATETPGSKLLYISSCGVASNQVPIYVQ